MEKPLIVIKDGPFDWYCRAVAMTKTEVDDNVSTKTSKTSYPISTPQITRGSQYKKERLIKAES